MNININSAVDTYLSAQKKAAKERIESYVSGEITETGLSSSRRFIWAQANAAGVINEYTVVGADVHKAYLESGKGEANDMQFVKSFSILTDTTLEKKAPIVGYELTL